MFKRLKDKITEEVKISPSIFSASVQQWQQMAQAVVSPNSNSVIDAPSIDSFSIDGDYDETPRNSPGHSSSRTSERGTPSKSSSEDPSTFTLVDLQESSNTPVSGYASSRRSSFGSTTSESPAILFPVLETGTANHFQSDLESCSERDESIFSSSVDNVSKEQLLSAFRKTQQRYHKYKGRYTDLIRHYRELERENTKARTVLAECQDKALRRAAELKEQCQLEQKAKAHLEEVLRSDLEEKDHLIHTLETKIQLLKSGVDPSRVLAAASSASDAPTDASLLSGALANDDSRKKTDPSESEVEERLQEKITNLEGLLQKFKEAVCAREERISLLEKDKESLTEREAELQNKIKALQLQEEETSLSVAENKLMVHQELESKEEVIRQLNKQLASANSKSSDLQREIEQLQEGFKKDLAAGKQEASRLIQVEMQNIVVANRKLEELLARRDQQHSEHEASLSAANLRLQELKDELESVRGIKQLEANTELSNLQATVAKLELALERSNVSSRLEPVLKPLQEIRASAQQLRGELTESLKATKSYIQDSVQGIHSRSSQLLAESTEELKRLRESQERSESELQDLSGKLQQLEIQLKEKEDAVSSFESQLLDERKLCSNLKEAVKKLECDLKEREVENRRLDEQLEKSKLALEESRKDLEEMREGRLSAESSEKKFIEELQQEVKTKETELGRLSRDLKVSEEKLEEQISKADRVPSLEAQIDALKSDSGRLLEEQKKIVQEKDKEIIAFQEKIASSVRELDALKVEKDKLSEEIARLEDVMVENEAIQLSEMQKSETVLNEKNFENEQLRNGVNTLEASCNCLKEEHSVLSRKLGEAEEKCRSLESEVEAAKGEVREKVQLISSLEDQVAALSSASLEVTVLGGEKEELLERVALLESRLGQCSQEMQEKETALEEKHVELGNLLNLKTQELLELKQELDLCKGELSNRTNILESKTIECESLKTQSSALEDNLNSKCRELLEKVSECEELASQKALLEREKEDVVKQVAESEALRRENIELAQKLSDVVLLKESLEVELKTLAEEVASQVDALKLKTDECAEKEAQLDSLAYEMKRVDELSQELGRISDESEANVQVLSAEASSLAQKVEELTAKTQQMKEREVELVAKAQLADACQEEFAQLKEAKTELQAKLARAEQAESQLAMIKEAQVELGNRLRRAEGFEKQCEQWKEVAAKVPELEATCAKFDEEVKRTQERAEEKCRLLKEEQEKNILLGEKCTQLDEAQERIAVLEAKCAQLFEAQERLPQLEAELRDLSCRCDELTKERDRLSDENSTLLLTEKECIALKTENEKSALLMKECAELKEAKYEVETLKNRCSELEERLKKSSVINGELEKLREESLELEKLRLEYKHLSDVYEKFKYVEEECDRLKKECSHLNQLEAECKALRSENARIGPLEEELINAKQQRHVVNTTKKDEGGVFDDDHLDGKRSSRGVEVEAECEDLKEQLKAAKAEIEDLRSDLEFVRTVPIERSMSPVKEHRISSLVSALEDDHSVPVPVVKEPVIAKKVKDLYRSNKDEGDDSESDDDDTVEVAKPQEKWKEAYESLLKQHKASTESNQLIIEELKGQLKLRDDKPRRKPWERKEEEKASFSALESKALAAEGNSVGLVERLQEEIAGLQTQLKDSKRQHRQEVSELRRMLLNNSHGALHGACTLEDATELEYLRNILFEYMMGKEPMVLARVIAAVVKFDSDQTKKILQKEEQRMTLDIWEYHDNQYCRKRNQGTCKAQYLDGAGFNGN